MPTRSLVVVVVAAMIACGAAGGRDTTTTSNVAAPGVPGYPATRWVPAAPSFVLASPTVADAQRAFRDSLDALGVPGAFTADRVGAVLARELGVDPLREAAVSNIGIDVSGGFAMFSESVDPTVAVRIAQPDVLHQFFEGLRQQGMTTESIVVDGVEVLTAKLDRTVHVSWATVPAADGSSWLLIHLHLGALGDDGVAWLQHARAGDSHGWSSAWDAATELAAHPALAGFGNLHPLLTSLLGPARDAIACTRLIEPIARVSLAIDDSAAGHLGGRLAFELGSAAEAVRAHVLAPPAGWSAASTGAAIAVAWNLDVGSLVGWLMPCALAASKGDDLAQLTSPGVRAGRAALRAFDPDDVSHDAGVVALDLVDAHTVTELLDQVPLRKHLESDRMFGKLAGHSLSVPTVGRVDYVVTDHLAILAMGDGLLDRVATAPATPAAPPPLVSIDVAPPALAPAAWAALFHNLPYVSESTAAAIAERMSHWRDGHVALVLADDALVLEASGDRR